MSSSGSTKDLIKAISTFVPNARLPLPDDLIQLIDDYLEKHADDGPSERLHEELGALWEKNIQDTSASHAAWLAILRRLIPALRDPNYLTEWWDRVQEPVLDHLADDKSLASEAWANTLAVLTCDDVEQPALSEGLNQLAVRLLRVWMHNVQLASQESNSSILLKAKLVRGGLLSYGKKRPKGLLAALDSFIVQKHYRAQALTLLCEFVQSQPPHLHQVLETSVFDSILKTLEHDTSTTVVTLAVTALTMLLPNVPSSLVPYLPRLFNIYARLLFWDRERSLAAENGDTEVDGDEDHPSTDWEKSTFSPDVDSASIPNLLSYFTILYGLYPINFVEYIRKPQRYLRHAGDPNADNIEVQPSEIRQKSERFRQCHVLHSNFYSLTVDSEKADLSRWIKSEASEVVAECTALCLATDYGSGPDNGAPHDIGLSYLDESTKRRPDQPFLTGQAILEVSRDPSWRTSTNGGSTDDVRNYAPILRRPSQSSHAPSMRDAFHSRSREGPGDSPTLPPSLVLSASHTNLQDMIHSNKVLKSGLQELANDSVPSLALSHQESNPEKVSGKLPATGLPAVSPTSAENSNDQITQLYKKILLLSNDLAFERYMKQQHMAHIGELKKRQLKEAATEAETQNIILINRNLRNRLEEAKRSELRAKKESDNRRNLSKKWESDLSAKLKVLREEQKKWNSQGSALKRELEVKTQECDKLVKMLCEYETTDLNSKQNQQAVEDHVEEIARLKAEVRRFVELERTYEAKQQEAEARLTEAAESISRAEMLSMKLTARDGEMEQAKKLYEQQISELNFKLQNALDGGQGRSKRGGDPAKVVESSLAASRAKMADLQRQHDMLLRKYTNLQSSLLDMKSNAKTQSIIASNRSGITSDSSDAEISAIVQGGDPPSPVRKRSTRGRGFSDPSLFVEGAKYNVTPPLDALASSSFNTVIRRPSTPGSGVADVSPPVDQSPTERFYGRGGFQNSSKKEKKDKKSSGIRGIRGFV
ncbi:hypothetical protein N0V93_007442 [Gnomoniopsis smithogilvyi]|uniref:Tuberous sclerosis 1 n=1 Tax=Gnomoniopsis smithogilvyi TaxID=1191159 RepID=A0A9W8YRC6_9PEZI|nr:hypothetical protein N0V93_007442 [Gnomoniopsis smithogilvyi]